jgi:hypothetical protein
MHPPEASCGKIVEVEADQEVYERYPGDGLASPRGVTEDPQGCRQTPLVATRKEMEQAVLNEREHGEVDEGKRGN